MMLHAWPYNVRELEQAIRSSLAVSGEKALEISLATNEDGTTAEHVEAPERAQLAALMKAHAGNLSAVARELKTSRSQVQRLLERSELSAADFKRG